MSKFSRRSFIASLSTIPFAVWFERYGSAHAPLVRSNATSAVGQQMLASYATGVKNMMNAPAGDPLGWAFQWYTHSVPRASSEPGAQAKANMINQTYPNPADPRRALAQAMWSTCQAHTAGQDINYFLPWHRMYVYFFERIVRKASGNNNFVLPYWNYSVTGAQHGVLPKQLRLPGNPAFAKLYIEKRNKHTATNGWANVNSGEPIDKYQPSGLLSTSSLAQCTYSANGNLPGFCMDLNGGLHGNVHDAVGAGQNMGAVPWAAGDPVFWMHHCNIDRLWASWNRAGRQNPTTQGWLTKTFTFVDEQGMKVTAKVDDFKSIEPLGYTFEQFETVTPCPVTHTPTLTLSVQRHAVTAGGIQLGAQPIRVALQAPPEATQPVRLRSAVRELASQRRLYLIVRGQSADMPPGVVYHLYLDMPEGTRPNKRGEFYVGTISFFDAVGHGGQGDHAGHMGGGNGSPAVERFRSFDITDLLRKQQSTNALTDQPALSIVPSGQPEADARPFIGEVAVVEQ
jgi:tyrosinase